MPHAPKPSLHKNIFAPVSLSSTSTTQVQPQPTLPFASEHRDHRDLPAPTTPNLGPSIPTLNPIPGSSHVRNFSSSSLTSTASEPNPSNPNYFQVLPPSPPKSPANFGLLSPPTTFSPSLSNSSLSPLLSPQPIAGPFPSPILHPQYGNAHQQHYVPDLINELHTLKARLKLLELRPEERDRWGEIDRDGGVGYEGLLEEYCYHEEVKDEPNFVGRKVEQELNKMQGKSKGKEIESVNHPWQEQNQAPSLQSSRDWTTQTEEKSRPHVQPRNNESTMQSLAIPVERRDLRYSEIEEQSRTLDTFANQPKATSSSNVSNDDVSPVSPPETDQSEYFHEQKSEEKEDDNFIPPGYTAEPSSASGSPTSFYPSHSSMLPGTPPAMPSLPSTPIQMSSSFANNSQNATPTKTSLSSLTSEDQEDLPLPSNGCYYTISAGGIDNITIIYPRDSLPLDMQALREEKEVICKAIGGWNRGEVVRIHFCAPESTSLIKI